MASVNSFRSSLSSTKNDTISISIQQTLSDRSSKTEMTHKRESVKNLSSPNVSRKIKKRKDFYNRLRLTTNLMCFLGISGIVLMIIDNEIVFTFGSNEDNIVSWLLKLAISISTILLLGLILYYHKLDLSCYSIRNSVEDWRIGLTGKKLFLIILEILICSIHPFPRQFDSNSASNSTIITSNSFSTSYVSVDIALSLPMFTRLYLLCRFMMFQSRMIHNVSFQSLGYLNQVSMDFSLLMKTYLEQWPTRCLITFCTIVFFIGSWSLRACNFRSTSEHVSMLDSMWLFIVTFTTVGYGDQTPMTYCSRTVAAISALIGIFSTALVISVLSQKLILTRWEKYVHNFVLNIELTKERKHQAANVIKSAIRVWCLRRKAKSNSIQRIKAQWKLFRSINIMQEVKLEQRKLIDGCVVLADLFNLHRDEDSKMERMVQQMNTINTTMNDIQNTLNVLLSRGQ